MNLLLFLSDRCNMACGYCFLDLNHGAATVLDPTAAGKAAEDHLKKFGRRASFTFLGGEPFIHFENLKAIAEAVRRRSEAARISVVTNGTLCCPEKLSALARLGASVTVSLDGAAATHDARRKLVGSPDSSLARALRALESVDKSAFRVNMVLGRASAQALLKNLEALRAEGFRDLSFHLDVMELWDDDGLDVLAKALAGFARYRRAVGAALRFSALEERGNLPAGHGYDDLVLGADARYYPCDGLFALPYEKLGRWTVGDARSGVDWKRREAWHRNAREFVHARLERDAHAGCAREPYFRALALGEDPDPAVRSFQRADDLLWDALKGETCARPA